MGEFSHGRRLWKFNKSLLSNKEYVEKIKERTFLAIKMLDNDDLRDEKVRWEYLKYKILKFTIRFTKVKKTDTISRGKSETFRK